MRGCHFIRIVAVLISWHLAACASCLSFYLNCHRAYQLAACASCSGIGRPPSIVPGRSVGWLRRRSWSLLLMCAVHSLNQSTVYDQLLVTCRSCRASDLPWMMWFPEVVCIRVAWCGWCRVSELNLLLPIGTPVNLWHRTRCSACWCRRLHYHWCAYSLRSPGAALASSVGGQPLSSSALAAGAQVVWSQLLL